MSDIRMQSIFLDEEFIYERSSYNRNGNREGSTRTKEELKAGVKNKDPRDKMRGASSERREKNVRHTDNDGTYYAYKDTNIGYNKHRSVNNNFDAKRDEAKAKNNKTMQRNLDGSQKHINASRSNKSWDAAAGDYKSKEKIAKHYEKTSKQESALMDMIEII